ncbi:MAG: hypothetical protein AAFQ42_04970 [Pseudomonadota bacterium]
MSLFKAAALVVVAIALLPSDRDSQRAFKKAALGASSEARSFCDARPNICLSREEAWDGFKAKAIFAYGLVNELVWGQPNLSRAPYDRGGEFMRHSRDRFEIKRNGHDADPLYRGYSDASDNSHQSFRKAIRPYQRTDEIGALLLLGSER